MKTTTTTTKRKKSKYIRFNQIKVGDRLRLWAYGEEGKGGIEYFVKVKKLDSKCKGLHGDYVPVKNIKLKLYDSFHQIDSGAGYFDKLHKIRRLPKNKKFYGES